MIDLDFTKCDNCLCTHIANSTDWAVSLCPKCLSIYHQGLEEEFNALRYGDIDYYYY